MSLTERHVVVLVTGIPAAGKSTVSDLLARRFGRAVHVRGDVFRRMVVAGRAEMTADPSTEASRQLRLRYALGAATADAYFNEGFSVVVQDVVLGAMLHTCRSAACPGDTPDETVDEIVARAWDEARVT